MVKVLRLTFGALPSRVKIKEFFEETGSLVVDVFTSGDRDGVQRTLILLVTCSFFSLLLSCLLLLYLFFTLSYGVAVAAGISGCFGATLTVIFFLSKRVRCVGILFVVSIFMKKSRSLLLTAGTSVVVVKNLRNTLENLSGLLGSMVCNLKEKKSAIAEPFRKYVQVLKWIGSTLKGITDLGVVNVDSQLKVSARLESETFEKKLGETKQMLNVTVTYVQTLVRTVSSVADRMFPAVSFLLLLLFIALHIKKYWVDVKYKNRFISGRFVRFDEKQKAEGRPHVLPLTPQERELYTTITSVRPSPREKKTIVKFGVAVVAHFITWGVFIAVDALLYCFVDIVTTKLSELEPFHVPMIMKISDFSTLIGIPLNEKNNQEDFSFSVTLFEKKCLPKPKLLLYESIFPLAVILMVLLCMTLMAGKMVQIRLMVCERFYSAAAEERVEHLHGKILRNRLKKKNKHRYRIKSICSKMRFWFPLLFRSTDDPGSTV